MFTHRRSCVTLLLIVLSLVSRTSAQTIPSASALEPAAGAYQYQDLGSLPGQTLLIPTAINNAGDVVGELDTQNPYPFLYTNGRLIDLGHTYLGGALGRATAINDSGQVVGYSNDQRLGFVYQNGTARWLPGLIPTSITAAFGVDDDGDIVGYSYDGLSSAVEWHNLVPTDLTDLISPGDGSTAWAVNDDGDLLVADNSDGGVAGVLLVEPAKSPEPLGLLGPAPPRMNDVGNAAITEYTGQVDTAYKEIAGVVSPLAAFGSVASTAYDINNHDDIVGQAYSPTGSGGACLYTAQGAIDLNTVTHLPPGVVLAAATGINDSGQICGVSVINGQQRGFLLTPVPGV